jgi:hypothetical protein
MTRIGAVALSWCVVACGSAAQPAAAPPAASAAAGQEAFSVGGNDAADAGTGLRELGRLRLLQPEVTLRKAVSVFPQYVPPASRDVRALAEMGVGPKIAGIVAFDHPIEMRAFAHTPNPSLLMIAEVKKGIDARAELSRGLQVEDQADGRLEIRPAHAFSAELGLARECELTRAGTVERIACGTSEGLVARAREGQKPPFVSSRDVALELDVDMMKPQLMKGFERGKSASSSNDAEERGSEAGRVMGEEATRELVQDLTAIEIGATLGDDAVSTALTLRMRTGSAFLARWLGSTEPAGPVPPRFFRLPADSDAAFFSRGVDAKTLEPLKKAFIDGVVGEILREAEYPDAIVAEGRQRFRDFFLTGGSWIFATGHDAKGLRDVVKRAGEARGTREERKTAFSRAIKQWVVIELDEPGEPFVTKIKEFFDFYKRANRAAKPRPGAKPSSKGKGLYSTRLAAVPPGLPPGTLHLADRTVRRDPSKNARLAENGHLLVVPEGDHVWIVAGNDEKTVRDHTKVVLEGQPAERTLAARSGADALRNTQPLTGGGFFALSLVLAMMDEVAPDEARATSAELKYMEAIGSKGMAPYFLAIRRGSGSTPELTIEMTASPRAVDELIGFAQLASK